MGNSLKSGPTFIKSENGDTSTTNVPMEEEEESMQGYEDVIRDTGPVPPESNATSVNGSDDETETSSVMSSKFSSKFNSKVTSREVSPSPNKGEPMELEEKVEVKPKPKHDLG